MNTLWGNARSIFVSDLHLGWRQARGEILVRQLDALNIERLYLVGDTLEWFKSVPLHSSSLTKQFFDSIQRLTHRCAEVWILPGNHDPQLAESFDMTGVRVAHSVVHQTAAGSRYLVVHGDLFDLGHSSAGTWRAVGGWLYPGLVRWGNTLSRWSHRNPKKHWCTRVKMRSKRAREHISRFEEYMASLAREHHCQGVICGHVHFPASRWIGACHYVNCGDWVEHCSMAIERQDGLIHVVDNIHTLVPTVKAA